MIVLYLWGREVRGEAIYTCEFCMGESQNLTKKWKRGGGGEEGVTRMGGGGKGSDSCL